MASEATKEDDRAEVGAWLERIGKQLRDGDDAKKELRALWRAIDEVCPELSQRLYARARKLARIAPGNIRMD